MNIEITLFQCCVPAGMWLDMKICEMRDKQTTRNMKLIFISLLSIKFTFQAHGNC